MANEKDLPIGCGVLVVKDGKILCGIRSDNGLCCGPGGHIEAGEAPEKAAVRETEEEFGITPKWMVSIGYLQSDKYRPSAVFACTEYEGDPKCDGNEMITCGFLGLDELVQLELHPAFEDSINLLLDLIDEPEEKASISDEEDKSRDGKNDSSPEHGTELTDDQEHAQAGQEEQDNSQAPAESKI